MRLTTKRNRWYFWRELFSYMIPVILIVGTIDVFYHFVQCPLHPEWSAPCSVNRILAAIYGIFLLFTIILAAISTKKLEKVKKQIEEEFFLSVNSSKSIEKNGNDNDKEKNNKSNDEDEGIIEMIEKNKHEEDEIEEGTKSKVKKTTKKRIFKKKTKN